jgi:putative FmdB family regulatory protein
MPTYDYLCEGCDHRFEQFQSMTADALRKCPQCGKLKLQRLIGTGAGVIFKGSGFYQTDYRSDSYKADAKAADKPATDQGKGCTPTCGTDQAPTGCQMAKKKS